MNPREHTMRAATAPHLRFEHDGILVLADWNAQGSGDALVWAVLRLEPGGYLSGAHGLSLADAHALCLPGARGLDRRGVPPPAPHGAGLAAGDPAGGAMSDITAEELARLRISLSALPGFDPIGLWLYRTFAAMADIRRVCDGHTSQGDAVSAADSSTADRLARWLAARVGLEVGCTAPRWFLGEGAWAVLTDDHGFARRWRGNDINALGGLVPAMVDLSPRDPRRLPDGSRYVDRLALALVAVHVGGQP